jgi:predicted ATPase
MEGKRLLHTLRLTNILSYGPEGVEIDLLPLNVLIGPNGSGKSNLIEAIRLLNAAPTDLSAAIRAGGGLPEWIWKADATDYPNFTLEGVVVPIDGWDPLRYRLQLTFAGQFSELADEVVESVGAGTGEDEAGFFYRFNNGHPILAVRDREVAPGADSPAPYRRRYRHLKEISLTESILSQRKEPDEYPELSRLGEAFWRIAFFGAAGFGSHSPLRSPQRADQPASFLLEDGRNLGMVLNDLLSRSATKKELLAQMKRFYESVEDITTKVYANTVETFFHERGFLESTPSIRLSDGTLHYLSLMTVLLHPSPPRLVCIEDPEIGLHPDILPHLADLLIEASQRMQLIVTTHSDILVSALSEVPEAVVVCERDDRGSHLRRLDAAQLDEWLKKYKLGDLWISGEIGGTT